MICEINSERVFDRRLGGRHTYIYELGDTRGRQCKIRQIDRKESKTIAR